MSRAAGGRVTTGPGPGFHGHPTLRLASWHLWLDVLATAGPRIVRLGMAGSSVNLLAETPDIGWQTPFGRYQLFGGHRLWSAPEDPELGVVPDVDGLAVESLPDGLRLVGRPEPQTWLSRVIEVRLEQQSAGLSIRHELRYDGPRPLELAPWSITQLPLGGRVLLPQAPARAGHGVHPNRNLVLWPYTDWADERLLVRDGYVAVDAAPGDDLKVGCLDDRGWIAYVRGATALVRRFEPTTGCRYPDLECNVETYCGRRYLELEILGPLRVVAPGETSVLDERWEIRSDIPAGIDPGELCAGLSPAVA